MALSLAQALQGGIGLGQSFRQGRKENKINALSDLLGSMQGGQLQSPEFRQLAALDAGKASRLGNIFGGIDDDRVKALANDTRQGVRLLESGNTQGLLELLNNREADILRLGGNPDDVIEIKNQLLSGDIKGTLNTLRFAEQTFVDEGVLKSKFGGDVKVQSAKILDDGTIIEVLKSGGRQVISASGEILTGDAARDAVKVSRDQAFNRKKELARLGQLIRREEAKEGLLTDQQKGIQRGNIQRLGELSKTSTSRLASIKKATKFKLALDKGEVQSGAGRIGASFIPGVFTKQAQFDEEFNAFAEIAARQALKASGETRPTDPDVEGMKRAMFGIGRDEQVNIILLTDFINAQKNDIGELDQLIEASKTGNLGGFTFNPSQQATTTDITTLSDEDLFK